MKRIDTHQHLTFKDRFSYPWMSGFGALDKGQFQLKDYWEAATGCEIESTIFVECDAHESQFRDEVQLVSELAENPENKISGVIASGRPEHDAFREYLDSILHPKLVGIRRILHTQPDELSTTACFKNNIQALANYYLPFDLCVLERQLPIGLELVKACEDTVFVIDHCGIPDIANHTGSNTEARKDWIRNIQALAEQPNTCCKISGIALYGTEAQRNAESLRLYIEVIINAFGWDRVVWGGDWPVCTLGLPLSRWCSILDEILRAEDPDNLSKLYFQNAKRIYRLIS